MNVRIDISSVIALGRQCEYKVLAGKLTFSDTFLQVNDSYQRPSKELGIGQEQSVGLTECSRSTFEFSGAGAGLLQ